MFASTQDRPTLGIDVNDTVALDGTSPDRISGDVAMAFEWAQWLVLGLGVYFAVGAVFALAFVVAGVGRIDVAARNMPSSVRILIFPGVMALWPLMLTKWLTQRETPTS